MGNRGKRVTAGFLAIALAFSLALTGNGAGEAKAAKKVKIKAIKVTNVKNKELRLIKGDTYKLKVKVKAKPNKSKYKKIRFVSSEKKVATVSKKGKIKAKKEGTTKISVISKKNKKKKTVIRVTVYEPMPPCGGAYSVPTTPVPTANGDESPSQTPPSGDDPGKNPDSPTPTPTSSPEPDGSSLSVRKPFAQGAHVGDTLSEVAIEGGSIVDSNGNAVAGSYSWLAPETVLDRTGIFHQKVQFTPEDDRFDAVSDIEITLSVSKAKITLTRPVARAITASQSLASSTLTGGKAVDEEGNTVPGTFAWTDASVIPGESKFCSVTFTPENTEKYRKAVTYVKVQVTGTASDSGAVDKTIDLSGGTWKNDTAYDRAWTGTVYDLNPAIAGLDMSRYEKITLSVKLYDTSNQLITSSNMGQAVCKLSAGRDDWTGFTSVWTASTASLSLENYPGGELYLVVQNSTANIGYIEITSLTLNAKKGSNVTDGSSLKSTYGDIFGKVGMALERWQITSTNVMNFAKSQYNSLTMGNEMKPDYILGGNPTLMNSNPSGYVDTADFTYPYLDTKYPKIDMDAMDSYITKAYDNGMKMRYHVFIWHAQTPKWFFKENYSTSSTSAYVTPEVMNGRLEYLIRNVMTHVYNLQNEEGVYIGREVIDSWDIANEYFHNYDKGYKAYWDEVYYPDYTFTENKHSGILTPVYIKEAFALAHSILEDYELTDSVSLLFNEFNTYMEADKIVKMINYFNTRDEINPEGEKICSGIGMQTHLDMGYPSVEGVRNDAIEKFRKAGFEIQITEFDLTDYSKSAESQQNQIQKWYDLMKMLIEEKDRGANITGVTWWGPSDLTSWRANGVPLLFSDYWQAKEHYFNAILAAADYNEGW